MEPIPVAVRRRVHGLYAQGRKTKPMAAALGYCRASVRRVRQPRRERGTLEPRGPATARRA